MPRNGSGVYSLPQASFVPNTTISSSAVNSDFSDIATALTDSVSSDGQTPLTGIIKNLSGSSSTPSVTFASDTTSGLYSVATGELGLVAATLGVIIDGNGSAASAAPTVSSGGTLYAVGDQITLTGGTFTNPIVVQVATLSGSAVSTVTLVEAGRYTTQAANPVLQGSTTGSGTGAQFSVTWSTVESITDLNNSQLWQALGGTAYFKNSVVSAYSGLSLANNIGSANIAAAVQTSLPVPTPQGYLTPVSNTPIITGDSTSATVVYYTPLNGLWFPIHNGTLIIPYQLSGQLSLTLTSSQAVNSIYDLYVYYNGGTPVFGTGPGWNASGSGGNITPGSCARSTGTGGAAIQRLQGLWTNAQTITLTYNTGSGNNTVSVPLNQGIYVGTLFVDATAGQVTCHRSVGQNRKFGIWNYYNRTPINLQVADPTSSWSYNTATIRASNGTPSSYSATEFNFGSGTTSNGAVPLIGVAEEEIYAQFEQSIQSGNASSGAGAVPWQIGIGQNSTTVFSGKVGNAGANGGNWWADPTSNLVLSPPLGINNIACLEIAGTGTAATFFGTSSVNSTGTQMKMTVTYRG